MRSLFVKKHNDNELVSSAILGTFSLTLSTVVVKLLGLVYKIPLSALLGDEGMGYFNSAYTIYAFFYLLCTAGVPKAVMIMICEARAKRERQSERSIFCTALILFLSLGIALCLLFLAISKGFAEMIGNKNAYLTMVAIAPSIIFVACSGVVRGYLSARAEFLDIAASQITEGVGKLVLGLLLATLGFRSKMPLPTVSALTVLGVTIGSLLGLVHLVIALKSSKKGEKAEQKEKSKVNPQIIKRIFSISLPITFSAAIMSLSNIIDLTLIMRSLEKAGYSEESASALYGNYTTLAVPMLNLAISLITPISIAYLPTFTRNNMQKDKLSLRESQNEALRLSAFISTPIMMGLMLFPKEILDLLFSNSRTDIGAALLCLLAPAIFFSSILIITNTLLESMGRVRLPLVSMLFGSALKILLSYLLITKTRLGILAAPISTVASYTLALILSLTAYSVITKSYLPIISSYLPNMICSFLSVLCGRTVYDLSSRTRVSLIISICFSALIYLVLSIIPRRLAEVRAKKIAKYTNF